MAKNKWLGWAIMIFLSLTWGSSFILMKKGLMYFPSNVVGALRMFMAFAVLAIPGAIYIFKLTWKQIGLLTLSGALSNAIPAFLFAMAQTGIDSYVAGILNSTTALFTLLIGVAFFKFKARWFNVTGVFIALVGVIGLLNIAGGQDLTFNYKYGLYVIIATVMYALNINVIKRYLTGIPTIPMVSLVFFIPGIFISAYLFFYTDFIPIMQTNPEAYKGLIYVGLLGIFGSAVALLIFYHMVKFVNILFAASITYLIPVVSIFWGVIDGEAFSLTYLLWIIVIIAGVFLVNPPLKLSIRKKN